MKKIIGILFLCTAAISAQEANNFTKLIEVGIVNHDKGKYKEAIEFYEKALKIQPNSELAFYEISLSYFGLKDYKNTIKYCNKILKKGKKHLLPAYINKGSALDLMGKTKRSIKVFKEAIEKLENNYLLHFNLAINYLKMNETDNAEIHFKKAVLDNPLHGSSHFYLAKINHHNRNKVPALLASYYFLLIEPETIRASDIYNILKENLNSSVEEGENEKNITINLNADSSSEFGAIELMISVMEASKKIEKNKDKSESELFVENTERLFKILGDFPASGNKKSIWWNFYVPMFSKIGNSKHIETYCKFITQIDTKSKIWLENNEDKMKSFINWLDKELK
ncbi:tetratricopeptide repeat protein [Tenacibaculum jejuense]|uniref:Uncharacterized protein n=1 Tax=Tenacibaculum jejuense TaxID=584609 RepID=A0A238UFN7_9FLAO|nr:tetratricopeptide repeat protein [Tenacibaculum jejuense]SNR17190.1 Protein of unknown function precursor [Tenacibaculum jejuense]